MILKKLTLAKFRGFEQIDLEFEAGVNVIAGVNGIGKSGVLRALAVLLSRVLPQFTPSEEKPLSFSDDDIKQGKSLLETSLILHVGEQEVHSIGTRRILTTEVAEEDSTTLRAIRVELQSMSLTNHRYGQLVELMGRIRGSLREDGDRWNFLVNEAIGEKVTEGPRKAKTPEPAQQLRKLRERKNQPIALYIPTGRYLPARPRSIPVPAPFEVKSAYTGALDEQPRTITQFMHWFHTQEQLAGRGAKRRKAVLDALRSAVTGFDPCFRDLRVIDGSPPRLVVDKNGVSLSLHQLSDGEQGLLSIYFEITRRIAVANPDSDDPLREGRGVLLVDEIDLHLHPVWQRNIIRRLTETFPGLQLIVTSHSPIVLSEVQGPSIHFLYTDDGKVQRWSPDHSFGWDPSRILVQLMGGQTRPEPVRGKLDQLFKEISAEHLTKANRLLDELEQTLGPNDPELTRAKSMLAFLGGAS